MSQDAGSDREAVVGSGGEAVSPLAGTSRRAFVLGGAAMGMAGVVARHRGPHLGAGHPGAGLRRAGGTASRISPAGRVGKRGLVGATVSKGNPDGTSRLQAAIDFDHDMGGRVMARAVERVYWGPNDWQTGPNTKEAVKQLNDAGIAIVGSFTPSQMLSKGERKRLVGSLAQLNKQKAVVEAICLTHEANFKKFPSAAAYQKYINYYGPAVVEAGYELAYIPLVLTTEGKGIADYYPTGTHNGQPLVTRMYGDFYCSTQFVNGVRLDGLFKTAITHKTPKVGLGEFGRTDNGMKLPKNGQFKAYTKYLASKFEAWNKAGHDSAAIMYFTNGAANNPNSKNYEALEVLWDALSVDHT